MLAVDSMLPAASIAQPLGLLDTQDLLALQRLLPRRYPVLLESSAASLQGGNYDMLMAFPGQQLKLDAAAGLTLPESLPIPNTNTFLAALDQWFHQVGRVTPMHGLPFHGGWFLYLSYELAAQIEPSVSGMQVNGLIATAVRMPAAIVRRSDTGESWFVAETDTCHQFRAVQADLTNARNHQPVAAAAFDAALIEDDPQHFTTAVNAALTRIAAGDIYQANLSRGWRASATGNCNPQALYQSLRVANPAPFAGVALLDDLHAVICSSPERLVEVRDGWANTRPIAGTRPRHADPAADQALLCELKTHPKERAEHIMLLDLERNDLGRICVGGTIEVNEYMSIESYAHVHHIVSNVRGRLRDGITPGAVIAATFPGGTITGCPKVRCMEIIAELEHTTRGAYTGSMGYLNRDGSMDLNILIRTLELQGNTVTCRAGAGIVADSVPERELDETRAKALGMLLAMRGCQL